LSQLEKSVIVDSASTLNTFHNGKKEILKTDSIKQRFTDFIRWHFKGKNMFLVVQTRDSDLDEIQNNCLRVFEKMRNSADSQA
jgi:secreted Zn-dependent insulinase-like peptidase